MADIDKITVIGFRSSGKTCFLAGMYDIMCNGLENFTIIEHDADQDLYLQEMWEDIRTASHRKWPVPSDEKRAYEFTLCHSFQKIIDFEWLDYPGGALVDPKFGLLKEISDQISKSSCLLLLINGESFVAEAENEDEYKQAVCSNLKSNKDLVAIQKLSRLVYEGISLPPIAIVVTKCDLIDDRWVGCTKDIVRTSFSPVFGEDTLDERIVMMSAVTLGDEIEQGGNAFEHSLAAIVAIAGGADN